MCVVRACEFTHTHTHTHTHTLSHCVFVQIRRLDGASVFVRIADGRRHEEVPLTQVRCACWDTGFPVCRSMLLQEVNLDYLPEERRSRYTNVHGHQKLLSELIPKDANQNEYEQKAATQFDEVHRSMILVFYLTNFLA